MVNIPFESNVLAPDGSGNNFGPKYNASIVALGLNPDAVSEI